MPYFFDRFSNNAVTTLAETITDSTATVHVDNHGNFPSRAPFRIVIDEEIMRVTSTTGAFFTVVRGQEGTTAAPHVQGVTVAHVVTKESFLTSFEYNSEAGVRLGMNALDPAQVDGSGTTVYALPFGGNRVALLDGTDSHWRVVTMESGIPLGLSGFSSGALVDVFMFYDESNARVALEGRAWFSSSARTASGEVVLRDGKSVRYDDPTRLYLGTTLLQNDGYVRTDSKRRFLWNLYNQRQLPLYQTHVFNSHTYGTNAIRQVNNNPDEQVEFVVGMSGVSRYEVEGCVGVYQNAVLGNYYYSIGFGYDTTSAMNGKKVGVGFPYYSTIEVQAGHSDIALTPGKHFCALLERAGSSQVVTVYGNDGSNYAGGIYGYVQG